MFFLIAGVQPKTKILDAQPQRCPRCGLHQAVQQRIDHYASLFFIPLLRIKKGEPFLFCRRCSRPLEAPGVCPATSSRPAERQGSCHRCGSDLEADFAYCPHCGRRR